MARTLLTSVLDKRYHAMPSGQCVVLREHPNAPNDVDDASRNELPNEDGVQCAPNDELNDDRDDRNDDGVDADNAQPHS